MFYQDVKLVCCKSSGGTVLNGYTMAPPIAKHLPKGRQAADNYFLLSGGYFLMTDVNFLVNLTCRYLCT